MPTSGPPECAAHNPTEVPVGRLQNGTSGAHLLPVDRACHVRLEADIVVERRDGAWVGIEVKLGGDLIDQAATALRRLAETRVTVPPAALVVLTGTEYSYRRPDGVLVVPLGLLGP